MARLTELAPSTSLESIESLKRRFLRQNRELARANSTQSVKIRSLETQISQLVAENVNLRAQVNQLNIELQDSRSNDVLGDVDEIRRQLAHKLIEFEGLVECLTGVGEKESRRRRTSGNILKSLPQQQSPRQRNWRSERGIGDVIDLQDQEGRLPTIAEGRYFPRRTLEPVDIASLVQHASSDSPDIGPPPRTFLDQPNEALKLARLQPVEHDEAALSGLLSANFETRRRRRETSARRDSSIVSALELSPGNESARTSELLSSQPIRAGAKRKLDLADRPMETSQNRASSIVPATITLIKDASPRKALAPKPVNTDPVVSPRKQEVKVQQNEKPQKRTVSIGITSGKPVSRRDRSENHVSTEKGEDFNLDHVKLEPKTPAPLDMFSPASTQPSTKVEGRGDTPPPADLVIRQAEIGGRVSRRARTNVSYAEPSLISKMRRPTKEFVDAVTHDHRRSVSAQAETVEGVQLQHQQEILHMAGAATESDRVPLKTTLEFIRPEPHSPLGSKVREGAGKNREVFIASQERQSIASNSRYASTTKLKSIDLDSAIRGLNIFDVENSPPVHKEKAPMMRPSSAGSNRTSSQLSRAQGVAGLAKPRTRRQTLGVEDKVIVGPPLAAAAVKDSANFKVGREERTEALGRRRSTLV